MAHGHAIDPNSFPSDMRFESGGGGLFICGGQSPEGQRIRKEDTVREMEKNLLSDSCSQEFMPFRLYGFGRDGAAAFAED